MYHWGYMSYCEEQPYYGQYGINLNLKETFHPYRVMAKSDRENLKEDILSINQENLLNSTVADSDDIFKHDIKSHLSYGLTFETDEKGSVTRATVKIFTYPSVESVEMQICEDGEYDFLNNYKAEDYDSNIVRKCELKNEKSGIFSHNNVKIKPNERYRFQLRFSDGSRRYISDLYSYKQKSLLGWPVAYNFDKNSEVGKNIEEIEKKWKSGEIKGKVDNIKSKDNSNFISSDKLRLVQIHVGTFTKDGTFASAVKKLPELKELGFNGVELMPTGYFYDKNWGYDPSFVFASQYGGEDEFRKFCSEAHKNGLNVIVDLVNNHYSMDCPDIMTEAGPYENPDKRMELPFGPRINYNDANCEEVREWRINEALYRLCYVDGIRFDLTDFTASKGFNTQLNIEIQEHFPGCVTFAESASEDADSPLPKEALTTNITDNLEKSKKHEEIIKLAQKDYWGGENQGFTHRWHFNWSHAIEKAMYYSTNRELRNLGLQIFLAQHQMKIYLSHDEIGNANADGNSSVVKIILAKLFGYNFCDIGVDREKRRLYQKASRGIRELIKRYFTGEEWPDVETQLKPESATVGDIDNIYNEYYGIADYKKGGFSFGELGLYCGLSREDFGIMLKNSARLYKAGLGFLFVQPGPKMVFQSFARLDNRFPFFRKNSPQFYIDSANKHNLIKRIDWETADKGHAINSLQIYQEANLDSNDSKYSSRANVIEQRMKKLLSDLNKVANFNLALSLGKIEGVVANHKDVIAIHSKYEDNEIFAITHFDTEKSYNKYCIAFPKGQWKEILNTNNMAYGGSGMYLNNLVQEGASSSIRLAKASTIIFKKVN